MRRRPAAASGRPDEVAVVEAAYWLDGSEPAWLNRLAQAAVPLLDEGWGFTASTWFITPTGLDLRTSVSVGGPPGFDEAITNTFRHAAPDIQRLPFSAATPCTTFTAAGGAEMIAKDPGSQELLGLGIRDCLMVFGADATGYATVLSAYLPDAGQRPSRHVISRWSRVASHLSAGFRVRRGLAASDIESPRLDPFAGSEAILTPAGRLEHAQGPAERARRALAHAVLAQDRARGNLRTADPDAALEAWKGLVAGRWSLLDHIDTDGKRFLVARKNDPDIREPAGLTPRERQVTASRARGLSLKLIAYDLGLSIATVSKGLQQAMAKLGVSSEADLPALFSSRDTAA
jgi:DNA-binding CsgD family transcriptional regulator